MEATAAVVPVIWVVLLRLAIGLLWLRSGLRKFITGMDRRFDKVLEEMASGNPIPGYANFLRAYVAPRSRAAGYFFSGAEVVLGLALTLGFLTVPAALIGCFFNLNFRLAAGWTNFSVIPLNYLYIVCQLIVIFSGAGNHLSLDAILFRSG